MAQSRQIIPVTRSQAGYSPQPQNINVAPVAPGASIYNNVPYGWNPLLPPPVVLPTRGVAPSPDAFQYPGGVMGAPWNDIQALIRKQKKGKGISFNTTLNQTTTVKVDISGTAKIFLGLKCLEKSLQVATSPQSKVSLMINSELIIDKLSLWFLCNEFGTYAPASEFFAFPRPLSGADSIELSLFEAFGNQTYDFNFYYL